MELDATYITSGVDNNANLPCIDPIGDYQEILNYYGLKFEAIDYHLHVGRVSKTQGWIIHLSVVISQILEAFKVVIPYLSKASIPFKIPATINICDDILMGALGISQIGKIISIYEENESSLASLAVNLISLTASLKGPRIPTDICLGGIVYTRYGSFAPIIQNDPDGNKEKYIYDTTGQLTKDLYAIPFQMPAGVVWPFREPPKFESLASSPNISNRVKLLSILKADPKGNVYKGIFLQHLFKVRHCVIKQGHKNMNSDTNGRDILDRLIWQKVLHNNLANSLPIPKIYDFLVENETAYLVMEYISGVSLYDKVIELNPTSTSCQDLTPAQFEKLLNYLIAIAQIIGHLHKKGYIHRDIVPVNFLVDKSDQIYLIDMELSYSLTDNRPDPPFTLGTPGFMSPEQQIISRPTVKEDIYGLGACILEILTGLTPTRFNTSNKKLLHKQLSFFIPNDQMVTLITDCLDPTPSNRPEIPFVLSSLMDYKNNISVQNALRNNPRNLTHFGDSINPDSLEKTIQAALTGLNNFPIPVKDGLWYSNKNNVRTGADIKSKKFTIYPSIYEGISGVIYMLSRLQQVGINIDACKENYYNCLKYLNEKYLAPSSNASPGFYDGSAGIALAISECLKSHLPSEVHAYQSAIYNCFITLSSELNIANGVSGQGVSILQCRNYLTNEFCSSFLNKITQTLITAQQKHGLWRSKFKNARPELLLSFGYGIPGIIWFLLEYGRVYKNDLALAVAEKSLSEIINDKLLSRMILNWAKSNKEVKGIIIVLIKAYEVLGKSIYKSIAENVLGQYSPRAIKSEFTQRKGMAGMGEVYLEAWNVFKEIEWLQRAEWITNVLLTTFYWGDSYSGYWILDENSAPTADFMTGIGGVIHYLARFKVKTDLGYPFLR